MDLGSAIKKCRNIRHMTQSELASKSGITISYISRLENNQREPNLRNIEAVAKALDIPLSILILLASDHNEIGEFSSDQLDALTLSITSLISHE
jgi:transcriptional regulator with XRE-family HTH domain